MYQLKGIKISNAHQDILSFKSNYEIEFHHTLNVNHLTVAQKFGELKKYLNHQESIVSVDGQWIIFALRFRHGIKRIKKNSGSDLLPRIIEKSNNKRETILLLGSSEENNSLAVNKAKSRFTKIKIIGLSPPFYDLYNINKINKEVFELIKIHKIKIIVLAFGVPKQEHWAISNRDKLVELGVSKVYFFGGAIDFFSGKLKRAPKWIQKIGCESLYRLVKDPARTKSFLNWLRYMPELFIGK